MFVLPSVPSVPECGRAANTFKANTACLKEKLNVTGGADPPTRPVDTSWGSAELWEHCRGSAMSTESLLDLAAVGKTQAVSTNTQLF